MENDPFRFIPIHIHIQPNIFSANKVSKYRKNYPIITPSRTLLCPKINKQYQISKITLQTANNPIPSALSGTAFLIYTIIFPAILVQKISHRPRPAAFLPGDCFPAQSDNFHSSLSRIINFTRKRKSLLSAGHSYPHIVA